MRKYVQRLIPFVEIIYLHGAQKENPLTHIKAHALIYLGLAIYLLFYLSAFKTGWFDIFFSGAALHIGAKGIDFYQLPRGAWAYWHGGSLTGAPLSDGSMYAYEEFANPNVYHPLFTLILGSFLMLFGPTQAPYIWLGIKLVLSLLVIGYFYRSFRKYKYVQLAMFLLLANFSIYLELAAGQFQFVLNICLLLFLIALVKGQSRLLSSIYYALGLLIKPVGLLFVFALFFKRQWQITLLGLTLFLLATAIFWFNGWGTYYVNNLLANLFSSERAGPNQIITLNALLRFSPLTNWPILTYKIIQYSALFGALLFSSLHRIHISKAIFFMIVYYLCFYEQVFEYQWSILAYVLAVCVVVLPEFQTRFSILCCLLICLPSCFTLLSFFHIDILNVKGFGLLPGESAWELMVVSKLFPVFLLCGSVLLVDVEALLKRMQKKRMVGTIIDKE